MKGADAAADRRLGFWIFALLACLYIVTFGGHPYTGDGLEMIKTAESLGSRGTLAIEGWDEGGRPWGYVGADGRRYSPYAIGLSLLQAPAIQLARKASAAAGLPEQAVRQIGFAAALSVNALATALTAWLLFAYGRALGFGRRGAAGASLLYALGTMAWVYAKHDFAEPLAACALLGAALFIERAGIAGASLPLLLAGAFNGYGFFTKYQMVLYTPFLLGTLWSLWRGSGRPAGDLFRRAFVFLVPGLGFGLANLWVNHLRFGSWLETGYAKQGEIVAGAWFLPAGLFGLLLSPGKGLLWYNPLLLAVPFAWPAFHRRSARGSLLAAAVAGFTFLMFGSMWWWHGDWAWGPRYLVVALPFLCLPLAAWMDAPPLLASRVGGTRLRLRTLLAVLLVAALAVNALGLTCHFVTYLQALRERGMVHDDWNYIPNLSPIRFHAHAVASAAIEAAGGTPPPFRYRYWCDGVLDEKVIPMDRLTAGARSPDYFFFRGRDTVAERASLLSAGALLFAGAFIAAWRVRRALAGERPS